MPEPSGQQANLTFNRRSLSCAYDHKLISRNICFFRYPALISGWLASRMKDMAATMSGPARLFVRRPCYSRGPVPLHKLVGNPYAAETIVCCSGAWFKLMKQGPVHARHDVSIKMLPSTIASTPSSVTLSVSMPSVYMMNCEPRLIIV